MPDEVRERARAAGVRKFDEVGLEDGLPLALDAAIEAAYAAGRADERARVVADLRLRGEVQATVLAYRYERGEHLG